jgi:hypothetical protein
MALRFHVLKKGALLVRHLYTKNINSIFSRVIHGTTSAHSIVVLFFEILVGWWHALSAFSPNLISNFVPSQIAFTKSLET